MAWIKRNLFFVVGGVAALLLLGVAAFYLFSNIKKDSAATDELNQQISELRRIYEAPVYPGNEEVNNISAAKKQEKEIRDFLSEARKLFVPVPTYAKIDDKGFNNLLLNTIYELQTGASNAGVALPPDYKFTFLAQSGKLTFNPGSIEPWTAQLGEIKAICNILYQAKINGLEGIRRVPVSPDDPPGTPDYLSTTIVTNDISITTPYEVTFRSFSGELGAVMNGILQSTNCLIVKTLTVEPSKFVANADGQQAGPVPGYPVPGAVPDRFASRYLNAPAEGPVPRGVQPAPTAVPGRTAVSTAPVVFLSEKPLRITLLIDVVKLKPQQ
jgi:hypothetical protein